MVLLISGNAKNILEIVDADPSIYGWLLTPRRTLTVTGLHGLKFGIDNEVYALGESFCANRYKRALRRIHDCHGPESCLFATGVDKVGDAKTTLRLAEEWLPFIRNLGLPAALVAQDGLEDLTIPWGEFDALFIGGTTAWKLGKAVAYLLDEAKGRDKWTHIGRVNSVHRASQLLRLADSADGSAWAKHPAKYAKLWQTWHRSGFARQLPMLEFIS